MEIVIKKKKKKAPSLLLGGVFKDRDADEKLVSLLLAQTLLLLTPAPAPAHPTTICVFPDFPPALTPALQAPTWLLPEP